MGTKEEYLNAIARSAFALDHVLEAAFEGDNSNLRAVAELSINSLHEAIAGLAVVLDAPGEVAIPRH